MRRAPGTEVHIVAGEEQDVRYEKKWMVKKAKDKAKKIKSKIMPKHHAHDGRDDHDHDHEYHNHQGAQSDEEDMDEEESIEPDPGEEVHIVAGEVQDVWYEKKSMVNKVKDKAKKIKSKIMPKHYAHDGHDDHDHDHEYHNDHGAQSDEEDLDDDESIE